MARSSASSTQNPQRPEAQPLQVGPKGQPGVLLVVESLVFALVVVVDVLAAVLGFDDEELRLKTGSVVPVPRTP